MNFVNYYLFAKQAASDFLTKGVDLNESIAKIAEKSGLSQVQIQRVVEFANHETNDTLRKTASDKTFTFPVAALDTVLSKMNKVPDVSGVEVTKVAELVRSFTSGQDQEIEKRAAAILASDDTAQELRTREYRLTLEKIAKQVTAWEKNLKSEHAGLCQSVSDQLDDLKQMTKDYMFEGGEFSDIHKYAKAVDTGWDNGWDVVFEALRQDMIKLGQPIANRLNPSYSETHKRSGDAVPEPMVSVVNGNTSLAKKVKQLHETIDLATRTADKMRDMHNFKDTVDTEVKKIKTDAEYRALITDIEKKTTAAKALYSKLTAPDDVHAKSTLAKLAQEDEDSDEAQSPKKSDAGVKARALMGLGLGHLAHSAHKGVLNAAAENLLQPNIPAAFDPTGQLPSYLRGIQSKKYRSHFN